jgi:hypothetical protein
VVPAGPPALPVIEVPPAQNDPDPAPPAEEPPPVVVVVPAGKPTAPTGLTAARHNLSGSLLVFVDWTAPAASPVPVTGYQIVSKGSEGTHTGTATGLHYQDGYTFCSPTATFEVRSAAADGSVSPPATVTVDDPVDCTPETEVVSATAEADGSVTVAMECHSQGRSPDANSEIDVLFDGRQRNTDAQVCHHDGDGVDPHTFSITGLQPATTYAVTIRTTSSTGTKTSNTVQVTTNP